MSKNSYTVYLEDYTLTNIRHECIDNKNMNYKEKLSNLKSTDIDSVALKYAFVNLLHFIPTNNEKDYKKSCNIIAYMFSGDTLYENTYKSCINRINDFISNNNIKCISFIKDDYKLLKSKGINLKNDIICKLKLI